VEKNNVFTAPVKEDKNEEGLSLADLMPPQNFEEKKTEENLMPGFLNKTKENEALKDLVKNEQKNNHKVIPLDTPVKIEDDYDDDYRHNL